MQSPTRLQSLPDEDLLNIFYSLDANSLQALCQTNANLSRFCRERSLRVAALARSYSSKQSEAEKTFILLCCSYLDERSIEKMEAMLDAYPGWVNEIFLFRQERRVVFFRPLEVAIDNRIRQLLLERGADARLDYCYLPLTKLTSVGAGVMVYRETGISGEIEPLGLATEGYEPTGISIFEFSMFYSDPSLHYMLLNLGYEPVDWGKIDLTNTDYNLDLLVYYALNYTPKDLSFLQGKVKNIPLAYYFVVLYLLQLSPDQNIMDLKRLRGRALSIIEVLVASYRQIRGLPILKMDMIKPNARFYLLRQVEFVKGDLGSEFWLSAKGMERDDYLQMISNVTIYPQGSTTIPPVAVNYYSGTGLIAEMGTEVLREARVMEESLPMSRGIPFSVDIEYRLDPDLLVLPFLLEFIAPNSREKGKLQFEGPDYAVGFKLGYALRGLDPEEYITIL